MVLPVVLWATHSSFTRPSRAPRPARCFLRSRGRSGELRGGSGWRAAAGGGRGGRQQRARAAHPPGAPRPQDLPQVRRAAGCRDGSTRGCALIVAQQQLAGGCSADALGERACVVVGLLTLRLPPHTRLPRAPHTHPPRARSHNTSFRTDEERLYKVGMIAAMDRKGKTGGQGPAPGARPQGRGPQDAWPSRGVCCTLRRCQASLSVASTHGR